VLFRSKFQDEAGGPLHGGDPGVLVVQPGSSPQAPAAAAPRPFARRPGQWLVLPATHLFGSEELSARSPSAATLVPAPYVGLAAEDMAELGIAEGAPVTVRLGGAALAAPAVARRGLARGVAVVPAGLCGDLQAGLPGWAAVAPEGTHA
jgi:NADH-quinone oxidoreductase subunit G